MPPNLSRAPLKGIIFDLDGTLLDSFRAHFDCYQVALARFGISIDERKFVDAYSPNWGEMYAAFGLRQAMWSTASSVWQLEAKEFAPNLFPGTKETLFALGGHFLLGLVTSGSGARVLADLDRTGIRHAFSAIATGDDVDNPKPAPDGLICALERLALRRDEVLYIGDVWADYQMAQALNVQFLGVRSAFSGGRCREPEFALRSVTELETLLGLGIPGC